MINLKEQMAPVLNELKRIKELCNELNETREYYEKLASAQAAIKALTATLNEVQSRLRHVVPVIPKITTRTPIELYTTIDWRKLK